MGRLCVQANLSTWHGVKQGRTGRHAPEAAGRQTRTRAAADGSDTARPASLAGPVRPALVSIRRVGLGEGRPPRRTGGVAGELAHPPWSWSRTGTMRPSRLLRKLAACRRVLVGLNKGEAHHALKRQLPPTRRTAGTEPGRGGTAGSPGLNLIAAREKAGAASRRCGLIDPEVPDLSAAPVWAAAACRRPAPALAPVPASALAPVPAPAPALA